MAPRAISGAIRRCRRAISALTSALQAVAIGLLDDHLKHCVLDAARMDGDDAELKIKEASDAIARLVRS